MYVNTGIPNMIKTGTGLRPRTLTSKLDVRSHNEMKPRVAKVGALPESKGAPDGRRMAEINLQKIIARFPRGEEEAMKVYTTVHERHLMGTMIISK